MDPDKLFLKFSDASKGPKGAKINWDKLAYCQTINAGQGVFKESDYVLIWGHFTEQDLKTL